MPEALSDDSSDDDQQILKKVASNSESEASYEEKDSDMEIAARDADAESDEDETTKFGLRGIYERDRIITRLKEIQANFYNRLSSQKLINNTKGRIPFSEHMTITSDKTLEVPEALTVHDDIKREIAFYNMTRENVKKGMEILVQAKIPISRPDDFFAEMLKSDEHMAKVKSRLLQQQSKIKTFEEKQARMENKKFHKAIKAYKQTERHSEKRANFEQINTLKRKIKERGGEEVDEREFNKIFNGGSNQ